MYSYIYFLSNTQIIKYLCRKRAKIAKKRNKKHSIFNLSINQKYNLHQNLNDNSDELLLKEILPPRRQWVKLSQKKRTRDNHPIDSISKNILSLFLTIKKGMNTEPKSKWATDLGHFCIQIRKNALSFNHIIGKPKIIPQPKDKKTKGEKICRPICLYSIQDSLIVTQTNRYFTGLFDDQFSQSSYAFRATKKDEYGKSKVIRHHDAFQKIIEYRESNRGVPLYVAECDMEKFFDSVDHRLVIWRFFIFCLVSFLSYFQIASLHAISIFLSYLKSYSFNKDVIPLNSNQLHFQSFGLNSGKYKWVEKDLLDYYSKDSLTRRRIGIPQGGALSGLIANIVLDYADKKIASLNDDSLLYLRYCDDMIIIHKDKEKCIKAFNTYCSALKSLRLVPHKPEQSCYEYSKSFWECKTKEPYCWDSNHFPWITFVGYDINYNGDIRIRKKSFEKEKNKQEEVVSEVIQAIRNDQMRTSNSEVYESTINRLIGMSVSRVRMRNYKESPTVMCWANGFKLLNDNKYVRYQLRELDRLRNRQIIRLKRFLRTLWKKNTKNNKCKKRKSREIIYYGKPFSYYYSIIEKKRK